MGSKPKGPAHFAIAIEVGEGSRAAPSPMKVTAAYVLRVIATLLTLSAAILMTMAKESTSVPTGKFDPSGKPLTEEQTIMRASDYRAFVYFAVANLIVFFYSIASLILSFPKILASLDMELPILFGDIVALAFVLTSSAAACALKVDAIGSFYKIIAYAASYFNYDPDWTPTGQFENEITAAVVLSMVATSPYLALIVKAILSLYNKTS